jgi:hypothetical protein
MRNMGINPGQEIKETKNNKYQNILIVTRIGRNITRKT